MRILNFLTWSCLLLNAAIERSFCHFRIFSSAMDLLKEPNAPEWFLICDVKSCYDSISHKWLLDNIPMNKHILKEFIEAGIVFNNEIFPVDTGISLGCNIYSLIACKYFSAVSFERAEIQISSANLTA